MLVEKTIKNKSPDFKYPADWGQGGRGCWSGGGSTNTTNTNNTHFVTISTPGNSTLFGSVTTNLKRAGGASGQGRGLICGGSTNTTALNTILYVTIATPGNASGFGNMVVVRVDPRATSNGTRAIIIGGATSYNASNTLTSIDYIAIATLGNASNFGLTIIGDQGKTDATGDGTYGMVICDPSNWNNSKYEYVAIDTLGNGQIFGAWTNLKGEGMTGNSNGSRAIWSGGYDGGTVNYIDYLTWSTLSNAIQLGNLRVNIVYGAGCEDDSRALHGSGNGSKLEYFSMDVAPSNSVISASFGTMAVDGSGHREYPAAYAGD